MKALAHRIYTHPKYAKAFHWGKLITIAGSAQVIVQAIGLVSGILIIRVLPTHEYALYTLANTMLGTMVLLADGGIATSVMAQGGKVWQNRVKLGSVLASGFDMRRRFATASLLIATPLLLFLLRYHAASWLTSLLIILSLIPSFLTSLSGTIFEIAPKLHQDISPLQKNQVAVNIARLALLVLTLFTFPFAFVAVFAAGLPQIWYNMRLRKVSSNYADYTQKSSHAVRKEIVAFISRVFPYTVYYCFSGQVTIWLISIFGTTETIAQVGALGRLAMVLGVFSMLFGILISPRFARLPINAKVILRHFVQIQIGLLALSVGIISLVCIFPSEVLWILGKHYSDLRSELLLTVIGSCLNLIAGSTYALYSSRGWAIHPAVSISVSLAAIVSGALLNDIGSLKGVLTFNIFIASGQVLMSGIYCFTKAMNADKYKPAYEQ